MNERELAENICKCHARTIVDMCGGTTIGGITMAERYREMWHNFDTWEAEQALRHWVDAAGYTKNGKFYYQLSNHILNT